MRSRLLHAKVMMVSLVSLILCSVTVLILLGIYTDSARSHQNASWFTPEAGSSTVDAYRSYQTFVFNASGLTAWHQNNDGPIPHRGYEHDVKVVPKSAIKRSSGWESNQPLPYLDVDAFDETAQDFTVGCDAGSQLQNGVFYFHLVNSQLYQGGQGTVEVAAQLVHRATSTSDPIQWLACLRGFGYPGWCNFIHDGGNVLLTTHPLYDTRFWYYP